MCPVRVAPTRNVFGPCSTTTSANAATRHAVHELRGIRPRRRTPPRRGFRYSRPTPVTSRGSAGIRQPGSGPHRASRCCPSSIPARGRVSMSPDGFVYRTDPSMPDTFLFDCRTVPRPNPNLVYICRGVCSASGFQPSMAEPSGYVPGCPVSDCRYNCRDEKRLLATQADYRLSIAADLQSEEAEPGVVVPPLRVIRCPKADLYAFDSQAEEPTRSCPLCGEPLPESPVIGEARELHYVGSLYF